MPDVNPDELLTVAVEAAEAAGEHALRQYDRRREMTHDLRDDIKLVLDVECQQVIQGILRKAYPEHSVLGEEGDSMLGDEAPCWIVDPIDGTVNFSHGLPIWCSSVAVRVEGRVLAGAVHLPMLRQSYAATLEGPATCNGKTIQVSTTETFDKAMVIAGLSKDMRTHEGSQALFKRLLLTARRTRLLGAAAADMCFVASGAADAYLEQGIYIWDMAAGDLIARRAGATTRVRPLPDASGRLAYLCCTPGLFDAVTALTGA